MQEITQIIIGIIVLLLGIPIGFFLSKITKEELDSGQKWFRLIVIASLILAFIGLGLGSDALLFSSLFIAIVTGMSLKKPKNRK